MTVLNIRQIAERLEQEDMALEDINIDVAVEGPPAPVYPKPVRRASYKQSSGVKQEI